MLLWRLLVLSFFVQFEIRVELQSEYCRYDNQSSGSLVVKALASHASGRGFDPPGGLSSKNPVGWESECL